jgi:hypothetical protein
LKNNFIYFLIIFLAFKVLDGLNKNVIKEKKPKFQIYLSTKNRNPSIFNTDMIYNVKKKKNYIKNEKKNGEINLIKR